MLKVSSANLMKQPSFKALCDEDVDCKRFDWNKYPEDEFKTDKLELEKQFEEMSSIANDKKVPGPVRAAGKAISVGIGAALGFVTLKYGYQGTSKVLKKAFDAVKDFAAKPSVKKVADSVSGTFDSAKKVILENKHTKKVVSTVQDLAKKFSGTKVGEKFAEAGGFVKVGLKSAKDSKIGKAVADKAKAAKAYVKNPEKVNKGLETVFAVSGGVTGGVNVLQGDKQWK